jgi:transposase
MKLTTCGYALANQMKDAKRLMSIPGIGEITATAVVANCKNKTDRTSMWVKDLVERRGYKRATVALAAKNTRLIWALFHSEKEYQVDYVK